jgi:SAM-dependent methyltransferase
VTLTPHDRARDASATMTGDEAKAQQAAMWGSAPFENIARTLDSMHRTIVVALGGGAGKRWLDIACGTGELARLAAATGADVTGCDLSPVLAATARRQAREWGIRAAFDVADCESLPYPDAAFDLLSSSVGAIFAPAHEPVGSEMARVCRPGGRLAMTVWVRTGHIAAFFDLIDEYVPPAPPGTADPMDWSRREHAEAMLPGFEVTTSSHDATWTAPSAESMVDDFATSFGPMRSLLTALPRERADDLLTRLQAHFETYRRGDGIVMARPYVLLEGVRRG